jgi:hypothetical protein
MYKHIIVLLFSLAFSFGISAKGKYKVLSVKENVQVLYKWGTDKENNKELRIRFKNRSRSNVNVVVEVAYYLDGINEETVEINDCLKKSIFDNWFRNIHVVKSESLSNEELESETLTLEATEFKIEETDGCRQTDQ